MENVQQRPPSQPWTQGAQPSWTQGEQPWTAPGPEPQWIGGTATVAPLHHRQQASSLDNTFISGWDSLTFDQQGQTPGPYPIANRLATSESRSQLNPPVAYSE